MTLSYVREYYSVPAIRGGLVTVDGRQGRILSATESMFVRFDDGTRAPVHPTWRVKYHECHEAVTDLDGIEEPCGRPATGYRFAPEYIIDGPYQVCGRHLRGPFTAAEAELEATR